MASRRIDLPENTAVDLTTAGALAVGQSYTAQNRGQSRVLLAELGDANPTATDIASNGFDLGVGEFLDLTPAAGEKIWAVSPSHAGRLTLGNL